ncbi:MAG: hypothetical protein HS115_13340 [Spirochaetales bacterium]|nr:hypothetical protein [Spirochaetales bacterium]
MSTIAFQILAIAEEPLHPLITPESQERGLVFRQETNPRNAWRVAETTRPELLIVSLDFERLAGEIFLRRFVKEELFTGIPVIALSRKADREKLSLLQELGVKDMLAGGLDSKRLMDGIEKFYRRKVIAEMSKL